VERFGACRDVLFTHEEDPRRIFPNRFPPRGSNESYYSNPAVDQALFYALGTTDREKKSAIYAQMQETIWKDAPWIFLVSEQNIAASSKALHGFYIQPDSSFNFEEASLEPASLMKP
jgi:glutathione transport system substrate-binding protein